MGKIAQRLRLWGEAILSPTKAMLSMQERRSRLGLLKGPDAAVLLRYSSHLGVALLASAAISLSGANLWNERPAARFTQEGESELPLLLHRTIPAVGGDFLVRAPVPKTIVPKRPRQGIITYTVQPGDTLYDLAVKFEINADTIAWANSKLEEHPDFLKLGQKLIIPPVSGVLHTVNKDDTLASIAKEYKVDVSAIITYEHNHLEEPYTLEVGQKVMVPGGKKPYIPRVVYAYKGTIPETARRGTGKFGWPTSGVITQRYWARHRAIDVGAPKGTPIYAADSGYVAMAGWSKSGYGYYIVINHGNGFETLYAHLSWYYIEAGQSVNKGQLIGRIGSTGWSTGPHLHFEIRHQEVQRNPFVYLP